MGGVTWRRVSYKLTSKSDPVTLAATAGSLADAAWIFASWRWANNVDYHSMIIEESIMVTPLHHHHSPERLACVVEAMRQAGPPRIRAHYDAVSGAWMALEGTHRLRAAKQLGIAPIMVPSRWPRSQQALDNARYAAPRRGHAFDRVVVSSSQEPS